MLPIPQTVPYGIAFTVIFFQNFWNGLEVASNTPKFDDLGRKCEFFHLFNIKEKYEISFTSYNK